VPGARREFSAGGVAVRRMRGRWWFAAIEPAGRPGVLALPKGLIDRGESAEHTALREVWEETGLECVTIAKLGDTRYVYTWAGDRVFKVVSFFLVRRRSGRLAPVHTNEVASARWVPIEETGRLSYRGEREIAALAPALLA
jgi:8-oxo-dGTP pyrophosphatase MutT (NUDIX family)